MQGSRKERNDHIGVCKECPPSSRSEGGQEGSLRERGLSRAGLSRRPATPEELARGKSQEAQREEMTCSICFDLMVAPVCSAATGRGLELLPLEDGFARS